MCCIIVVCLPLTSQVDLPIVFVVCRLEARLYTLTAMRILLTDRDIRPLTS